MTLQSITLQTSDNDIATNDKLGSVSFAASNESDGSVSVLIGAAIDAVAEGNFTNANNPTAIVFSTATNSTATGKLKISNGGHLLPLTNNIYDIGSSSLVFRSGYFSNLSINGSPFNNAVSGLLPTITNSGDNRVLTSTGSTVGINGESNLVFDGSRLGVNTSSPTGALHVIGSGLISTTTGITPHALLHAYSATTGSTIFNVEGTNGSLFSVVDSLSGSLMSVNNNAGLPVFEVFSDDSIIAGRFNNNDFVLTSGGNIGVGTGVPSYKFHVIGTGNFSQNLLVNGTAVSLSGHAHTTNDILISGESLSVLDNFIWGRALGGSLNDAITSDGGIDAYVINDFNSAVSGLLPTISNSGNNRILTSTGSANGIDAESNATFDGSSLVLGGNGTSSNNGQLYLNGANSNRIEFNVSGVSDPSLFIKPNGQKILLYPSRSTATADDFSIGVGGNDPGGAGTPTRFWQTIDGKTSRFQWYAANNNIATLTGSGVLTVSGDISQINVDNLRLDGNTISATNSNGNIIIQTTGTGALQRDSGGDARGEYAVDWQTVRSTGTMVAAGNYSVIGGGLNNRANGTNSVVGGGIGNISSGSRSVVGGGEYSLSSGSNCVVGGGNSNISSGAYSTVGGGNSNQSANTASFIGGGTLNSASAAYSSVCGGYYNLVIGSYSAIGGGRINTCNAEYSFVGGGNSNICDSNYSSVCGGSYNSSNGPYSVVPGGLQTKTSRHGELSHAAGCFAFNGDAQHSILVVRRSTTDATANVVLTLNGASPGSTNRLTLPAQTSWAFSIKLSAYNSTDNGGGWWIVRGGIRRNNSSGTALIGSLITENGTDSSLSSASISVVADDTNEALEIRVTGISGKTIRWVAVVDLSQVSFGTP